MGNKTEVTFSEIFNNPDKFADEEVNNWYKNNLKRNYSTFTENTKSNNTVTATQKDPNNNYVITSSTTKVKKTPEGTAITETVAKEPTIEKLETLDPYNISGIDGYFDYIKEYNNLKNNRYINEDTKKAGLELLTKKHGGLNPEEWYKITDNKITESLKAITDKVGVQNHLNMLQNSEFPSRIEPNLLNLWKSEKPKPIADYIEFLKNVAKEEEDRVIANKPNTDKALKILAIKQQIQSLQQELTALESE